MSEIRMTGEMRTDYDCEVTGLPAERWGEAVFSVNHGDANEDIVFEFSVEKDVIISIMAGQDSMWKGTLKGFKQMLDAAKEKKVAK